MAKLTGFFFGATYKVLEILEKHSQRSSRSLQYLACFLEPLCRRNETSRVTNHDRGSNYVVGKCLSTYVRVCCRNFVLTVTLRWPSIHNPPNLYLLAWYTRIPFHLLRYFI